MPSGVSTAGTNEPRSSSARLITTRSTRPVRTVGVSRVGKGSVAHARRGTYPSGTPARLSPMTDPTLPPRLRTSWSSFLDTYEPLRADLYRFCRHLTRSPWDAEDLAQDTLARAFVTLAQMGEAPKSPRSWLFRVASNLWIDRVRRQRPPEPADEPSTTTDARAVREAAGTLIGRLAPQERAAVVLKDVFDFSLEEVAEALSTTTGAVKAALHRGRGKLEVAPPASPRAPAPAALDAFCAAFNAGDLDRLTALLLDTASVEVVGATTMYGPEAARRTVLHGMLFGGARAVTDDACGIEARFARKDAGPPRVEAVEHRGEWILLHWYPHDDGEAVRAVTRLETQDGRVARLRNYFFDPDLIGEVCGELGVPFHSNGYRWFVR
jgi:RNA polymerase sigma-70 factor (ECF subfamily)